MEHWPEIAQPFKRQPQKMAKHIQTIRWQKPTNCLSVFDHFVGLALKGLTCFSNVLVRTIYGESHCLKVYNVLSKEYIWGSKGYNSTEIRYRENLLFVSRCRRDFWFWNLKVAVFGLGIFRCPGSFTF